MKLWTAQCSDTQEEEEEVIPAIIEGEHTDEVTRVATFMKRFFVSAGNDGTLCVWQMEGTRNGEVLLRYKLKGTGSRITSMR